MLEYRGNKIPLVYIDPGHDAVDVPGNCGAQYNGCSEQAINWTVAKLIKSRFGKNSRSVILTRRKPFDIVGLKERAKMANKAGADLFLSIHCNAHVNLETKETIPKTKGIETFYMDGSEEGRRAAEQVQKKLIEYTGANDRGVKANNFMVLRKTAMPAVLTELGFLTNPTESSLLQSAGYQNLVADALVQGVVEALRAIGKVPTISSLHLPGGRT